MNVKRNVGEGKEKRSLEESILEELERTGFPTEIVAARTIERCGWSTILNPLYIDPREKVSREFDIRAYKFWDSAVNASHF